MRTLYGKILSLVLVVSVFVFPIGFYEEISSASFFPTAYAGGDSSDSSSSSVNNDIEASFPGQSQYSGVPTGPGPATDASISFGIMDVISTVVGIALGPVAGLAVAGIGAVANSLGVANPGVSVGIGQDGVSVNAKADTGINGTLGLAVSVMSTLDAAPPSFSEIYGGDSFSGGGDDSNGNGGGGGSSPILSTQYSNIVSAEGGGESSSVGAPTCPAGYDLCGTTTCIPTGNVCCASAGFTDRYCPANTICRTDGQCEQTTGGRCAANRGEVCTSPANSCGMTTNSLRVCNGSCPAIAPADSSCPTPEITLTITPAFINPDESCTVRWTTTNTTSCTLSGTGAPSSVGTSGTFVTPPLTAVTNYTVQCYNGTVVNTQVTGQCRINPAFQEL